MKYCAFVNLWDARKRKNYSKNEQGGKKKKEKCKSATATTNNNNNKQQQQQQQQQQTTTATTTNNKQQQQQQTDTLASPSLAGSSLLFHLALDRYVISEANESDDPEEHEKGKKNGEVPPLRAQPKKNTHTQNLENRVQKTAFF